MKDIINILPKNVANQIAAGEVVQRPASVVKELLENSIDAGSSQITIHIKDSGKTLIQIIDNGKGMSKKDAILCFERHTTSKISKANDLFNITTKGFRGEALASIAAVSHVNLITKQSGVELGTNIYIQGSEIKTQRSVVSEKGTTISVKNLFFNIPARRNFLKSDNVEFRHITNEFLRVSLSHPEIKFTFINNGVEIYNLTKSTFKKRIINLFGVKTNEKLVPVSEETEILKINGFIFKPEFAKKTRGEQYFFVNNRFIKSPYLNHAINSAFEGLIDVKHNPSYFLNLEVDAATIDINIHPTKTEIKFEDEHSIYAILRAAVKHSIGQYSISPVLDFQRDKSLDIPYNFSKNKGNSSVGIDVDTNYNPFEHPGKNKSFVKIDSFEKEMQSLEFSSDSNNLSKIDFKELTKNISVESTIQIDKKYIINKNKSSLIIVNQQRAHQRILYEKFLQSITLNNYGAQKLLHPIDFDFSTEEISVLNSNKKILNQFGLIFNCGKDQLTITSMPAYVEVENLKDSIDNLIFNLNHEIPDNSFSEADLISKIMAKSLSIKNGTILDVKEQQYIINALFACKESLISPFNKKTYVKIEYSQIDNMFK
jgi:DNA mismatch repair protein MutL|tara:strand:- start:1556 stop:3352 length:1797 start_codon:yes stop_codon:yes gene_type:complete